VNAAALAVASVVVALGWRVAPYLSPARLPGAPGAPVHRFTAFAERAPRRRAPLTATSAAAWCDDAARALRAGSALGAAIAEASRSHPPMAPVTDPVLAATARGRSLAGALRDQLDDPSTPAGLILTVLVSCSELGGPAASPLERAAATLRTRAAISEEQLAHSAQARLSARVLTLVPVAMLALLALADDAVRAVLARPAGISVVTAGAVLNVAGWWWMRRIIGADR